MSQFTAWPQARYQRRVPVLPPLGASPLALARALAWSAQLAYETDAPDKTAAILRAWGWELVGLFAGGLPGPLPFYSAHGFVARVGAARVIAFSGTDPARIGDWMLDLMAHRTPDGAHAGFDAGVDAIWPAVCSALGDDGPIYLTGHSLGGALAMIAAFRLRQTGDAIAARVAGVSTYGAPRVGDASFAAALRGAGLGELAVRLVYGSDLVPRLPPAETPFGYRHVGQVLACRRGHRFVAADLRPDEPEVAPSGKGMIDRLTAVLRPPAAHGLPAFPGAPAAAALVDRLPATIRDHMPDRYLHALGLL